MIQDQWNAGMSHFEEGIFFGDNEPIALQGLIGEGFILGTPGLRAGQQAFTDTPPRWIWRIWRIFAASQCLAELSWSIHRCMEGNLRAGR